MCDEYVDIMSNLLLLGTLLNDMSFPYALSV
jgi:hypothetical protein